MNAATDLLCVRTEHAQKRRILTQNTGYQLVLGLEHNDFFTTA